MSLALIVEDYVDIRTLFRMALENDGFTVLTAPSVNTALAILETQTPEVVLLDVNMPERPGTDVLIYINMTPRLAKIKKVVITADPLQEDRVEELGIDLFLVKPVDIRELSRLVQRLIA
jgi:CheY-like chemotaxis protein